MTDSPGKRSSRFPFRAVIPPLLSVVVLYFLWRAGLGWVAVPVVLLLVCYYVVLPRLVRSRLEKLNREVLLLLGAGKAQDVVRLVRRSIVLQLFGPAGAVDAKLAMAYGQLQKYRRAIVYLKSAIPHASATEKPALVAGLAKAHFVTGDLSEAQKQAQALLDAGTHLPELFVIAARSRMGLGVFDDQAAVLLDKAKQMSVSRDERVMIDLVDFELKWKAADSKAHLADNLDASQRFVRAWIHLARGMARQQRGDQKGAEQSLKRAIKADSHNGFVTAAARGLLDPEQRPTSALKARDPHIERKRRKRK